MRKHLLLPALLLPTLAAAPATTPSPTTSPTDNFLVTGTITDDAGHPLPNATIYVRCGPDTNLTRAATTRSDKSGHYRLPFDSPIAYERSLGHPIVGFQTANILVSKPGYAETNLSRQGDLAMTDDPPGTHHDEARNYAGVIHIHQPYHLDFTLAKAATIEGTLLDPAGHPRPNITLYLTGPDLLPLSPNLAAARTDAAGHFRFRDVPTNHPWSYMLHDRDFAQDILSPPFTLTTPEPVTTTLTSDPEKHTLTIATPAATPPNADHPHS